MTRAVILKNTVSALSRLPKERLTEAADFINSLLKKNEDMAIENLSLNSGSLDFLVEEEELYTPADLKKKFH